MATGLIALVTLVPVPTAFKVNIDSFDMNEIFVSI